MTIDQPRRDALCRAAAWPGASARRPRRAIGIVLLTWALSVDFVKASATASSATPPPITPSATASPTTSTSSIAATIWCGSGTSSRAGPKASSSSAAATSTSRSARLPVRARHQRRPRRTRLFYAKAYIYPLVAAPFIWLFGTNGFLVLHALLMTLCFAVRVCVPRGAQSSGRGADLRVRVLFVSRRADLHGADRRRTSSSSRSCCSAYFFWCYKEVVGAERRAAVGAQRACAGSSAPLRRRRRRLPRHRDVLEADAHPADRAAAGVGGAARAVAAQAAHRRCLRAASWRRLFA